jgi:hypothetical protein
MVDKLVTSHESEKMMPKITNIVEYGLIDVECSSQRAIDELKVSFKEI